MQLITDSLKEEEEYIYSHMMKKRYIQLLIIN
ncbi:hypothetical protein SDC9_176162 [bioreactor metagenome]|uniref:Uncharacterized protein n=1 Tax=bioreactor metagenome TaxID=1076179 RepID=A0A645GPD0_9ZZZZ